MTIEHHPLVTEFPEHRNAIHRLKAESNHFRRLMDEYEEADKEIVRMEENIETPEDAVLNQLKKQRLHLKDQIADMLGEADSP
ncbi:MAG: YdcH family protein [Verrucomicrobiota bacterium]